MTELHPQASASVFALSKAAAIAHSHRPFIEVQGEPLLGYGAMPKQTARAAARLGPIGVARGERALVHAHKSPAAVIRDLPSAGVFMAAPSLYTRLLAEEIP